MGPSPDQPEPERIWPHWSEGVPTKFCAKIGTPASYHTYREYWASLRLIWNGPYLLSFLEENRHLLPSTDTREWSGVYRIFSPNTIIDRSCGKDPTGTLYLGLAGTGRKSHSILRTRINSIVKKRHQAFSLWRVSDLVRQKFPWDSLSVEWAFTGEVLDHLGNPEAEAIRAEGFLLNSYNDSFGEYPPWNVCVDR
jgi:hypothetical protein